MSYLSITQKNKRQILAIFMLLGWLWAGYAQAAELMYVTDRLAAAMYPAPRAAGKPMDYLPTGTALRVLTEQRDFVRVRTQEGVEGWIQRQQLQEDVPAQVLLLSLAQQHERTTQELDRLRQQLADQNQLIKQQQRTARPWWVLLLVGVALCCGFIFGTLWLDWRLRERHGGFRL